MDAKIQALIDNIEKVIVGKRTPIVQTVAALLTGGHVLLEDVPGVGKTQLAAALAKSVNGTFSRVQMTPDIMPSDITGFSMLNRETGDFEYRKGAAFCNFLLADEINRASPKAQSSLLEVMEERQVSIDGATYALPAPFMVIATQNPVETYGTYHLPEAQMDRFAMKISMGYPTASEESEILDRNENENPIIRIAAVLSTDDIIALQEQVKKVRASQNVKDYIISVSNATRSDEGIKLGVSPRGSIALYKSAKAWAFMDGRDFITPQDVKDCCVCTLAHRIMLSPKGKSMYETQENAFVKILERVPVPTE
ncbi:MAG: MoxR family ATPase [Oscillospiraceae bacterium]|nr:MoxR family ATPase [Ruminococcus sp.]MDE7302538.1 MoxR family ATPase [Oscillospiraceae bacterium]